MTKITIVILTFIFLIQGCDLEKIDNDIVEFESTFSDKNIKTLNKLVLDLDNFLSTRFPSNTLDGSYKYFLTRECQSGNFNELRSDSIFFSNLQAQFKNSGLEREVVLKPDKITLIDENKSIVRYYNYFGQKQEVIESIKDTFLLPPNPNNIDLTKIDFYNFLDKRGKLRIFNVFGEYYRGLEKVKDRNKYIASYLDYKHQVLEESGQYRISGFIDFSTEACGLVNNNVNLTDYFVKRIIIIELLN